jgi:hypothetical protein
MAAGTSKLLGAGLGWASGATIRLMILSHTEVEEGFWTAIHWWAANHPYVCIALSIGTLIIQLGAFMLVFGPRWRRMWAVLIVAFHGGIYLTSHILFLSPMLFAATVAVPWSRLLPRRTSEEPYLSEEQEDLRRPATQRACLALLLIGALLTLRLLSAQ